MKIDRGRQLLAAIADTFQSEANSAVDIAALGDAHMTQLHDKIEALTKAIEEDSTMTDTPAPGMPYTLESADFSALIKATAQRAENDINTLDTEIATITAKFKADVQSRQARIADLQMIVTHGNSVVEAIRGDSANVVKAIEDGLSKALDEVGKELSDFGTMLTGKKAPAPQIVDKKTYDEGSQAIPPAPASITIK